MRPPIHDTVEPSTRVYTDAFASYLGVRDAYTRENIDHAISFVEGNVHTSNVENFRNLLKWTLKGAYVSVDPVHLDAYLDEQAFK